MQCLAGTPVHEDASSAMEKVAAALPSRMRAFRDRLPDVLNVKATPLKKRDDARFRRRISLQRGARPSAGQDALLLSIEPADAEHVCYDSKSKDVAP